MEDKQEIENLQNEILRLGRELEEKENDLQLAGEFGQKLLEDKCDLSNQLEEITAHYVQKIEELEQEKHTLKIKLEQECKAKASVANDIELMKEKLQREGEAELQRKEAEHEKKLAEVKLEISQLETEVEKQHLVEKQSQAKIERLEASLAAAKKCQEELKNMNALESDLEEYQEAYYKAKSDVEMLQGELSDTKDVNQQLAFDLESVQSSYETVREQLKEKSDQVTSMFECLQETRQELAEAQAELQVLKIEVASSSFKKKGNSLFGELEDRRIEAEKNLISLKVQHESLQKVHSITKQQLHRLKCQVVVLFQMRGGQADIAKIRTLEDALSQSQGEVQMLLSKLQKLEKLEVEYDKSNRMQQFHNAFTDFGDKKDYVEFLQQSLQDHKNSIADFKKEIQTKTLLQLGERDKLRDTEKKLYTAESKAEQLQTENMKLRLKLDGLKVKLQNKQRANTVNAEQRAQPEPTPSYMSSRKERNSGDRLDKPLKTTLRETERPNASNMKFTLRWEKLPGYVGKKEEEETLNKPSACPESEHTEDIDTSICGTVPVVPLLPAADNDLSALDPAFAPDEENDTCTHEIPMKSRKPSKVRFNLDVENMDTNNAPNLSQEQILEDQTDKQYSDDFSKPKEEKVSNPRPSKSVHVHVKTDASKPNECAQQ